MPSVAANQQAWDKLYTWEQGGDEWSAAWGGAATQWYGTLLPRVRAWLPAEHLLEIAPGHGRWTQFLHPHAGRMTLVDLSASCIEACRKRFAGVPHLQYAVNDGRSLAAAADRSVDLVFSFDSLVHVEADVVQGYLSEIARVLKPGGAAFLHHSNLAALRGLRIFLACKQRLTGTDSLAWLAAGRSAPTGRAKPGPALYEWLTHRGWLPNVFWRSPTVSAELVRGWAAERGLCCVTQELVNWYGPHLLDTLTTLVPADSPCARPTRILRNPRFMAEAQRLRELAQAYDLEP